MKFSFDIRGHLSPYGKNEVDPEDFKAVFVDPFEANSSRHKLYEGFLSYNQDLKALLAPQKYVQWVDGSFISTKINPRDIDVVNLIEVNLVEQYEQELSRFTAHEGKRNYGIDGYVIRIYPEGHPKYVRTQSDLVYWEHWFSHSRMNRAKKRFLKGFVEIKW